jgi:hypothetical protein
MLYAYSQEWESHTRVNLPARLVQVMWVGAAMMLVVRGVRMESGNVHDAELEA